MDLYTQSDNQGDVTISLSCYYEPWIFSRLENYTCSLACSRIVDVEWVTVNRGATLYDDLLLWTSYFEFLGWKIDIIQLTGNEELTYVGLLNNIACGWAGGQRYSNRLWLSQSMDRLVSQGCHTLHKAPDLCPYSSFEESRIQWMKIKVILRANEYWVVDFDTRSGFECTGWLG